MSKHFKKPHMQLHTHEAAYNFLKTLLKSIFIPQETYLLCFRILSRAFTKCWSFCFSNHFCNNSFCFRLSYQCCILSFIVLWSYFHIRRGGLNIWTHADGPVSPALLSYVSSAPGEAFSLFSSINFRWGGLGGSFFFCRFLGQDRSLANRSHTHLELRIFLRIKIKGQFPLLLQVQKVSFSFLLSELQYFSLSWRQMTGFPVVSYQAHAASSAVFTHPSPVRWWQICVRIDIPPSIS